MKPNSGSGDGGETSLRGGRRTTKDSAAVEALGAIDEASAAIGLARALVGAGDCKAILLECQRTLAECASGAASAGADGGGGCDFGAAVAGIEGVIERLAGSAKRPQGFVMPGDTAAEAALNLARTAVRRAERAVVALRREDPGAPEGIAVYLNRLSDLLFEMVCEEGAGK